LTAFLAVSGFDSTIATRCFEIALVYLLYLVCGPLLRCLVTTHCTLAELRMAKQKNPAPVAFERASIDAINPADIDGMRAVCARASPQAGLQYHGTSGPVWRWQFR
jgi:hypothetical protein